MSHPVIPAPARFDGDPGQFALRSGTRIAYTAAEVAPIVERFCSEIRRRTGRDVAPIAGHPEPQEPSVRIELAPGDELSALPAPQGLSPQGDNPPDERHSLQAEAGQILLRAAEPVGVARALTTLLQLTTATTDQADEHASGPRARIVDAPRYAWRGLSRGGAHDRVPAEPLLP